VEADFLLIAYGCTANSAIVKEFDPSIVNADGRVMVKPSLQLASTDGAHDRIFAIGDVNDIKVGIPSYVVAKRYAHT
jgi:NADH dehydrogenase FAD-containing subunit